MGAHGVRLSAAYGILNHTSARVPHPCSVGSLLGSFVVQYMTETMLHFWARWLASLSLYQRIYEGPEFREYLQRSTEGQHALQAAQMRFQLRLGTSMLRQHDSRFKDQPSHDRESCVFPAWEEPDSIESIRMCCCIALHINTEGQLYIWRLLVYQQHRPLPRYCLMMRESLPSYEMTSWEEQRKQPLQWIHSCTLSLPLGTRSNLGDNQRLTLGHDCLA